MFWCSTSSFATTNAPSKSDKSLQSSSFIHGNGYGGGNKEKGQSNNHKGNKNPGRNNRNSTQNQNQHANRSVLA